MPVLSYGKFTVPFVEQNKIRWDIAYLTDRIRLAEGKKQLYGTQVEWIGGTIRPKEIEDPSNVDQRRKKLGLKPLEQYLRECEQLFQKR